MEEGEAQLCNYSICPPVRDDALRRVLIYYQRTRAEVLSSHYLHMLGYYSCTTSGSDLFNY